jgi:AcrR family transcriptional regulator
MVLLKNKSPDAISVCEITSLAHVNRNSFYTHYKSISDVMVDIYESIFAIFSEVYDKYSYSELIENPYPFMKEITLILIENSAFSEYVMFSKDSGKLVQDLIDKFTDKIYVKYLDYRKDNNPNVPYLINFLVGGTIEMIYSWFKNSKNVPIEDLLISVSTMIKDGISLARSVKRELNLK